jgi:hypothetical protein
MNFVLGKLSFKFQGAVMVIKKGRPSYPNDDYSRFAGADYQESDYEHPGVSGKDQHQGTWFNEAQYQTQRAFIGKGPKGYRRTDERIYEDVCEELKRSPAVDASEIEVEVNKGEVFLRGSVPDRECKREAERCLDHLSGIEEVHNQLHLQLKDEGLAGIIKNQIRQ